MVDDGKVFVLIRCVVMDDETKAIGKRYRLINAVVEMNRILSFGAIAPVFTDEVATIGRCIDQDVFRAR